MLQYLYILSASPVKSPFYVHVFIIDLYFFLCSLHRKTLFLVAVDFVFSFSLVFALGKIEAFLHTVLLYQFTDVYFCHLCNNICDLSVII